MSRIHLESGEVESAAQIVNSQAAATAQDLQDLRGRLAPLSEAFQGQSAEAFQSRVEDWQLSAQSLLEALDSLGDFLRNASEQITATDAAIAGALAGAG